MRMQILARMAMAALILAAGSASVVRAGPLSATITYYSINDNDPDANHLCCSGPLPEVQNNLGLHGLPLLIPGFTSGGNAPQDVNSNGELTYWSPTYDTHVTQTLTTTTSLPFNNSNMYNPNGTGSYDGYGNGYLAAIISATLTAPTTETITFTVSSDDNAFVYLDGQLVCNDGGVHGPGSVDCTSQTVGTGNHDLEVFYDDLNQTGAVLDFTVDTEGVTTAPAPPVFDNNNVPEPESFVTGIVLMGALLAARRCKPAPSRRA